MWAIKSVEELEYPYESKIISLNCDKVHISPNQKITLIDYDTEETKTVYRYDTLVYYDSIFKTCETFSNNRKFDIDMTKVIGYCQLSKINLKLCSRRLYKLLDYIERIDVLTDSGGIFVTGNQITLYDENNIFGSMEWVGDFDISDLLTVAALVDSDRLNKMIDDGVIYIITGQTILKVVLVKNKDISRLITKLVTLNSNSEVILKMMSMHRLRKPAKSVNFGVAYGMSANDIANKMFGGSK